MKTSVNRGEHITPHFRCHACEGIIINGWMGGSYMSTLYQMCQCACKSAGTIDIVCSLNFCIYGSALSLTLYIFRTIGPTMISTYFATGCGKGIKPSLFIHHLCVCASLCFVLTTIFLYPQSLKGCFLY